MSVPRLQQKRRLGGIPAVSYFQLVSSSPFSYLHETLIPTFISWDGPSRVMFELTDHIYLCRVSEGLSNRVN